MNKFNISELISTNVAKLLNEGRLEDVKSKYMALSHDAIDWLSSKDPSGNNKYLAWMSKQTLYNIKELQQMFPNDGDQRNLHRHSSLLWKVRGRESMIELINFFHENGQKYQKKDINQYSNINELEGATEVAKTNLSRREMKDQGGAKVYEDDNFVLIHPKTHEASCKYGSSTRWCVTMRDHTGYFERYSIQGPLFFLIDKRRMPATNSPKYMTKAPDYYKVAIHYQPKFNTNRYPTMLRRLTDAAHHAGNLSKEEFVNSASIGTSEIDYWNVQDRNVAEGTFLRYLGGPGKGQKERAEATKSNLFTAMESYTKKLLSDYYVSIGDTIDNSGEIAEINKLIEVIENKRNRLGNVRSAVDDAIYYLEDMEDYMEDHSEEEQEFYEPFKNISSHDKIVEMRNNINRIDVKIRELNLLIDSKNKEITNLQNLNSNNFAYYDLTTKE